MQTIDPGFAITPECFSGRQCDEITAALSVATIARSRAGIRHLMTHPRVAALASGDQLIALAKEWLGRTAIPFRATLFEKSTGTNWLIPWHQDTALPVAEKAPIPGWGPWSQKGGVNYAHAPAAALSRVIALRVHLDDSNPGNGPLRVVPGSHLRGVLTDQAVAECVRCKPQLACTALRGGIIAMRPLLIHASSKAISGEPRRVLHIEYADSLDLDDGIRLAVV